MVSPVNRLNYVFHYDCATEMEGLDHDSRENFVTGIYDDSRSESLEKYAEISNQANILDSADAALVYELEFENQEMEVRLEYHAEEDVIGVDVEDNGKRAKFINQISEALDGTVEIRAKKIAPQL